MDIRDIQYCAGYYQSNYLETFYMVSTYNERSFLLVGEKENFPHLMGIAKSLYNANGYRSSKTLYTDILAHKQVSPNIIPIKISSTSKMYKKAINFLHSMNVFWKNQGPLAINYDISRVNRIFNADLLISDIKSGYMLGWAINSNVPINAEIKLRKYCACSWIDESNGSTQGKEKYLLSQDVELIRHIFAFDKQSNLIKHKEYKYDSHLKKDILLALKRNNANLIVNVANERFYIEIAKAENINCRINGMQY